MKLQHITFTGVDAKTDINRLKKIQKQYPIAEFGVLTSYHWYENGYRYLDPREFRYLTRAGLKLALHICGQAASDAARGEWSEIHYLSWGKYRYFRRIQLNVAERKDVPPMVEHSPWGNEIIIQQKAQNELPLYENTLADWQEYNGQLSVLLDSSGGRGIDTKLKVLPLNGKVGYAGGFSPDNVEEKLSFLMSHITMGEFWIDMESGVRTDDWFDLDKVERVLEICQPIIEKYQ